MVVEHHYMEFFFTIAFVNCTNDHSTAVDSHHLPWWKVYNGKKSLSYEFFRLIVLMDSAKDRTICSCPIIKCKLKELLTLRNCYAFLYLYCSEIRLTKCIEVYLICQEVLYLYATEIDL